MLIESGFLDLPPKQSFNNGVALMGGPVFRLISSLNQLAYVKCINHAYYHISRNTYSFQLGLNNRGAQFKTKHFVESKGTQSHNFLLASLPHSVHLALVLRYASSAITNTQSPLIEVALKDGTTLIDAGIKFEYPLSLNQLGSSGWSRVLKISTGSNFEDPAGGSYSSQTSPRPLFIPTSSRGNVLNIETTVQDCNLLSIDVFEIYRRGDYS